MGIPGPGGAEWAVALLLWAALGVLTGEFVRILAARFAPLWRRPEPIERLVLDFYLGGALLYLLASVPWGAFVGPVVFLVPAAAVVGLVVVAFRSHPPTRGWVALRDDLASLLRPVPLLVLLSALALFLVELAVAIPIATGNTFDSSLLTTYTSLLLRLHTTPLSFSPYASTGLLYPQGATVWLGGAQLLLGPPPARTALLVTPLFFGLAPLAGFTFGRRVFGSERAGLAVALVLAWLGVGTRGVVFGSNDFVFAFPLVLLLAGQAVVWWRSSPPAWADVLAFGVLLGYSAAMNPVGAEWLLLALPLVALLVQPRFGSRLAAWWGRWAVAVASTFLGITPSLYVLSIGHSSPGFVPGATSTAGLSGISTSQFIGSIDPFLFGSSDTGLSTVAALRFELAVLIALGLAVLLLVRRDSAIGRYLEPFRPFVAGSGAALIVLLGVLWAAHAGFGPAVAFANISSPSELSLSLFTLYGLIAAVPLALALERFTGWMRRTAPPTRTTTRSATSVSRPTAGTPRSTAVRAVLPLVVGLVIVVPGVVLTPTALPPTLSAIYDDFGNVTAADFGLLDFAGSHLPSGARVLVAPGSAGQFLTGYCPDIVLLYPMVPGWPTINASYERLVRDLPNATFGPADRAALASLDVGYIVVTGNNTLLWWAFSPHPFLADPASFPAIYQNGDAYLFQVVA